MAVPLAISTRRVVRPDQRLTRQRCQDTLRSLMTADSFFRGLPLIGRRPRPLHFCGGKPNKLASRRKRVTTQAWLRTAARNSIAANARRPGQYSDREASDGFAGRLGAPNQAASWVPAFYWHRGVWKGRAG